MLTNVGTAPSATGRIAHTAPFHIAEPLTAHEIIREAYWVEKSRRKLWSPRKPWRVP
jgi:hypothetical protein